MYQIWCYGGRRPPLLMAFSSICLVSTASYTLVFFFVFSEGSKSTNGLWMNVFVKALPTNQNFELGVLNFELAEYVLSIQN